VVAEVGEYTHLYIASILRHDDPPEYPEVVREYLHAYDINMADRENEFAMEIHEADADKTTWRETHHFAESQYAKPSRPKGTL
jgi:hypothetical protein